MALEGLELARKAVEAASEKHASDIVLLDMHGVCSFTDYFVICSAESGPQLNAIRDEVERVLKKLGETTTHREGSVESGWLLLDYTDVVVHAFSVQERENYALEKLWVEAKPVIRIQ